MTGFSIGKRHVGDGSPTFIIAEVAQAHDGSLMLAHAYIDAIAKTGADAVKFQCHLAEAESTPDEPWRVEPRWKQDASRYEYWKRTSFTAEQWRGLKEHADAVGLEFLCSPFSVDAVKLLDPLVPAWKVPSGEIGNIALLDWITETRKPVLMSTGMSEYDEIEVAVEAVSQYAPVAVMQCTSEYPTHVSRVGLNNLETLRMWNTPVGLSDHSGTMYAGLGAVALGANIVEVHVKLSEHDQGLDASSSISMDDLRRLVEGARFLEKARQPVDKDTMAKELEPMRRLFMDRAKRREVWRDKAGVSHGPNTCGCPEPAAPVKELEPMRRLFLEKHRRRVDHCCEDWTYRGAPCPCDRPAAPVMDDGVWG